MLCGILKKPMTRTKNDTIKPLQKIDISVTEILVTGDGHLKPYIQTFHYEPENIALAPLGSVLGIFEIEDHSEDSAYIVNFLASVVKKEYFSHPKRSPIENLEATLHKVNLALAELIKQDNTAWLGKLNAALCVFEKNNIHFSVAGKGKTLLMREGVLSDISDGLAEESTPHPLKTFVEVSSGRLKSEDKIILTTPGLFDICSPEELRRNAERFSNEKFSQFLKTALVNQLTFGSTIVVDIIEAAIQEPVLKKAAPVKETPVVIPNAFSQSAFSSKKPPKPEPIVTETPLVALTDTLTPDIEYTDSKTGHIYVQGDDIQTPPNETWLRIQLSLEDAWRATLDGIKKTSSRISRSIRDAFTNKIATFREQSQLRAQIKLEEQEKRREQERLQAQEQEYALMQEHIQIQEQAQIQTQEQVPSPEYEQDAIVYTEESPVASPTLESLLRGTSKPYSEPSKPVVHITPTQPLSERFGPIVAALQSKISMLAKILPNFSVIKQTFSKLSPAHKKYALIALVCIFVVPLAITKLLNKPTPISAPIQDTSSQITINPLTSDKNIRIVASASSLFSGTSLIGATILGDTPFAIAKTSVVNLSDPSHPKAFTLPSGMGSAIVRATTMHDLNMIFLMTNTGKLVAFTPTNHAFTENTIAFPDTSHITAIATYLTYLYVLDDKNNSITRYPRTTGGFGDGTSWLKDSVDIQDSASMAISEDLYLSQTDHMLAFNKGKTDAITFESSSTPIVFSKVFTQPDMQAIYVLDAVNGRVILFDKSGALLSQYANDSLKQATSLSIDEPSKKAYFSTSSEVFLMGLE